jgi:plastocyanin
MALDASGQLQWFQQVKPHDLTDADFEDSPILATVSPNGATRTIVVGAGKDGHVLGFDKQTGEQLWKTAVGTHQNDNLQSFPADTPVTVFPGNYGGVETPMAFADGTVFVPVANASADFYGGKRISADFAKATGELDAIDAATGQIQWEAGLDAPDFGAATVVGDLVVTSTFNGKVLAFDRALGARVWTWQAPGGINGFLSVAGDTLLVPVGLASAPQLVALKIGASVQAVPQPSATPNPAAGAGAGAPAPGANQLTVSTPANAPLSFDTTTLTAAAGAQVTVQYTNDSSLPHNWHLFDGADANAPSLAQTPIKSGPGDVETVQFTAPTQPGSYFYQCDVHPTMMTGQLVVN